jgi:hypothetical protein
MSSLALLCAAFISRTQTAVYLGFVIFIGGWVMQTVGGWVSAPVQVPVGRSHVWACPQS